MAATSLYGHTKDVRPPRLRNAFAWFKPLTLQPKLPTRTRTPHICKRVGLYDGACIEVSYTLCEGQQGQSVWYIRRLLLRRLTVAFCRRLIRGSQHFLVKCRKSQS